MQKKNTFVNIVQVIALFFFLTHTPSFAQIAQKGADYPTIINKNVAVIVIDFPDTPQSIKDKYFPTIAALRDTIFNGNIKKYLADMSYNQFTLTGDVFGYFTHQNPGFVNGWVTEMENIQDITTITIPGFEANKYDAVIMVSINDAGLAGGRNPISPFLVNGKLVNNTGPFVPIQIGIFKRDPINYPDMVNSLSESNPFDIPTGENMEIITGRININYSQFCRVFTHELFHLLDVGHANSRTNGTSYDFEPEEANNNCGNCYPLDPPLQSLLNLEYGNKFDVMGTAQYGMSLNMAFRDRFGWTNFNNRFSIKNYGHYTATIYPMNNLNGIRTVEIRIPYKYGDDKFGESNFYSKNKGYFLEVRSGKNQWDKMLLNPQLAGNNDGIMVIKTDGVRTSRLLDMSPSPNIRNYPDIRDVVLKPGMVYDNKEIKLSNVVKNQDGSFKVDIDINPVAIIADGSTRFCQGGSVKLTATPANSYLWSTGEKTQSINVSSTGYYSVTLGDGSGAFNSSENVFVNASAALGAAGVITGKSIVNYETTETYSIPAIPGATVYQWSFPWGTEGVNYSNTVSVTFRKSNQIHRNDTIRVFGYKMLGGPDNNYICAGKSSILPITFNDVLLAGEITGNKTVCIGATETYSILPIEGADSYIWTLPTGATGNSTTNSIKVTFSNSAVSGNIKVKGRNSFDEGPESTLAISLNPFPASAGTITGTSIVCQSQNSITYSVPVITNANSYEWTLPAGATGTSSTNSITINYGASAISGSITVKGKNMCFEGEGSSISITVNPLPSNTGPIAYNPNVCQGQNEVNYSIPAISNATSYIWTLPTGATGNSTTNSISVNYSSSAVSGNIIIKGKNSCGVGNETRLIITVNPLPVTPIITQNLDILRSSAAAGNQWYNKNSLINGATNQDYSPKSSGDYYVVVTSVSCSSSPSNTIHFISTGIEPTSVGKSIKVYPNPVTNELIIEFKGNTKKTDFEIINSINQVVFRGKMVEKAVVTTANLTPGIYLIKLTSGEVIEFIKIVKK